MKTRDEAIAAISAEVVSFMGLSESADVSRLNAIIGHYYDLATGYTGYDVLPDALLPFVTTACIRAWNRRGAEAVSHFTGISVSETYIDIEGDLKKTLSRRKNPLNPVVVEANEEDSGEGGDENA